MTKKDYTLLAKTLRQAQEHIQSMPMDFPTPVSVSMFITAVIADALAQDRAAFNVEKFVQAAMVNWNK